MRGLNFKQVVWATLFDLSSVEEGVIHEYIARIGRVGRMGNSGSSLAFYTNADSGLAPDLVAMLRSRSQVIPPFLSAAAKKRGVSETAETAWTPSQIRHLPTPINGSTRTSASKEKYLIADVFYLLMKKTRFCRSHVPEYLMKQKESFASRQRKASYHCVTAEEFASKKASRQMGGELAKLSGTADGLVTYSEHLQASSKTSSMSKLVEKSDIYW